MWSKHTPKDKMRYGHHSAKYMGVFVAEVCVLLLDRCALRNAL